MARGVEEGDGLAVDLHLIRADVLRDAAGLAGGHMGVADRVQQGGLAVVDVAHDHHDGGAGLQLVCVVLVVVEQALLNGDDDLLLDLAAELLATKEAVSKSIIWLREAMTPFFIRHLTTSAPVFFMRVASSPTVISSGICTVTGVFLMTSSRSLRRRSASSCLRLLLAKLLSRRCRLLRNFSLPWGAG